MDTSYALAQNIVDVRYEDLPAEVIEITKKTILDTIGVLLAATTLGENGAKEIVELVMEGGGKEESTILGFGVKAPSWMVAFANGALAHQLDYDDAYDIRTVHSGAGTLPAALAIAERQGHITGKEFITAVALGVDTMCRISLPLTKDNFVYGWARTGTLGKYGATVAAGKLLGLDASQIVSAFGLVLNQATISMESSFTGGSDIRAIRDGFGAKAGVLSTLLSQKGVVGDKTSLDGKYGLYNLCYLGDSDPAKVTEGLGKKFLGVEVSFKPWPCCRNIHGFIEAALHPVKEHGVKPKEIADITVVCSGQRRSYYETLDERRKPKCSMDAKFSLPFVLGVALARGDVLLEDFTTTGIHNPIVLELAQKVTCRFDEKYKRVGNEIGVVEVSTKDGRKHFKEIPFAYGHPNNPIAKEDLFKKFKDCASHSIKPLTGKRVEQVIDALDNLQNVKDMREVVKLLC